VGRSVALGAGAAILVLLAVSTQLTVRRTALDETSLISDQTAGRAVSWGALDCYNRGSPYESAAVGCSNPAGCDVWGRANARPSFVPECGATSDLCVEHFKTCLMEKHSYTRRPEPTQCDCYEETVYIGCSPACVDSIFQSYGQLSQRCYNFNAYEGCLYIDGYRLPAERYMSFRAPVQKLLLQPETAPIETSPEAEMHDVASEPAEEDVIESTNSPKTSIGLKQKKGKKSKNSTKSKSKKSTKGNKEAAPVPPPAAAPAAPPTVALYVDQLTLEDDMNIDEISNGNSEIPEFPDVDFEIPEIPEIAGDLEEGGEKEPLQDEEDFPGDFWTLPADLSAQEPKYGWAQVFIYLFIH